MRFDLITIFPGIFDSYFNESIIGRAIKNKKIKINVHNLRDWTFDRHNTVDDRPYGGGVGLLFKVEPIDKALTAIAKKSKSQKTNYKRKVILFAANGKPLTQKKIKEWSQLDQMIMICPRYEGVDARVEKLVDEVVRIGDYVLTGGEIPAMTVVDAVSRLLPGVIGKEESHLYESHSTPGVLEHPHYTRPETYTTKAGKKLRVPKVLLSGHHESIEQWRQTKSKKVK